MMFLPNMGRHASALQQTLTEVNKQLDLSLHVQVETMQLPSIMSCATDFVLSVKTTLNEAEAEQNGELPFRTRLKGLLKTLVIGLPYALPHCRWEVPRTAASHMENVINLSVENIEAATTFSVIVHTWGASTREFLHGARFRVRATETLEARLVCK